MNQLMSLLPWILIIVVVIAALRWFARGAAAPAAPAAPAIAGLPPAVPVNPNANIAIYGNAAALRLVQPEHEVFLSEIARADGTTETVKWSRPCKEKDNTASPGGGTVPSPGGAAAVPGNTPVVTPPTVTPPRRTRP
jgi:hypothetical protein